MAVSVDPVVYDVVDDGVVLGKIRRLSPTVWQLEVFGIDADPITRASLAELTTVGTPIVADVVAARDATELATTKLADARQKMQDAATP